MALPFEFGGSGLSYAPFTYLTGAENNYVYPFAEYDGKAMPQATLRDMPTHTIDKFSLNIPEQVGKYPSRGPNSLLGTEYQLNKEAIIENTREPIPTQQMLPPSRQAYGSRPSSRKGGDVYYKKRTAQPRGRVSGGGTTGYFCHIVLLLFILFLIND